MKNVSDCRRRRHHRLRDRARAGGTGRGLHGDRRSRRSAAARRRRRPGCSRPTSRRTKPGRCSIWPSAVSISTTAGLRPCGMSGRRRRVSARSARSKSRSIRGMRADLRRARPLAPPRSGWSRPPRRPRTRELGAIAGGAADAGARLRRRAPQLASALGAAAERHGATFVTRARRARRRRRLLDPRHDQRRRPRGATPRPRRRRVEQRDRRRAHAAAAAGPRPAPAASGGAGIRSPRSSGARAATSSRALDGTLLVGATVEDVGFDERTTAAGVRDLLDAACELLPEATGRDLPRCPRRPAPRDARRTAGARDRIPTAGDRPRVGPLPQRRPARADHGEGDR